jgi:hypothetical protein
MTQGSTLSPTKRTSPTVILSLILWSSSWRTLPLYGVFFLRIAIALGI